MYVDVFHKLFSATQTHSTIIIPDTIITIVTHCSQHSMNQGLKREWLVMKKEKLEEVFESDKPKCSSWERSTQCLVPYAFAHLGNHTCTSSEFTCSLMHHCPGQETLRCMLACPERGEEQIYLRANISWTCSAWGSDLASHRPHRLCSQTHGPSLALSSPGSGWLPLVTSDIT